MTAGGKRWNDCGKKRRYRDEEEARRVLRGAVNRRGVELRVYECPYCKGYHLTKHT